MKRIIKVLFFFSLGLASFFIGAGEWKRPAVRVQKEPDRPFPTAEHKSFAVLLYAHNAAPYCGRALKSIFGQDYDSYRIIAIDDGSEDGTYDKLKEGIVESLQDHRAILIRNETPLGLIGSLARASDHCNDGEILIPLEAKDWLVHDAIFKRLDRAFQNPDAQVVLGQSIAYPSYQIGQALAQVSGCPPAAFYASLFKSLHVLQNDAYLQPLLEKTNGRVYSLDEPIAFSNKAAPQRELAF